MLDELYYKENDSTDLKNHITHYFPNTCAALITGSHLNKKRGTDIDIIIFADIIGQSFVEKIQINSQEYDIICFSTNFNNILDTLYYDINSRFGAYRNMILSSKILFDDHNILPSLFHFVKEKGIQEYGTLLNNEIYKQAILISNSLKKLEKIDSFEDHYIAFQIFENTSSLILAHKRSSIGNGIKKLNELQSVCPTFYAKAGRAIETKNPTEFKKIILDQLNIFEGVIKEYSPKKLPTFDTPETRYEIIIDKTLINERFDFEDFFRLKDILAKYEIHLSLFYFFNNSLVIDFKMKNYDFKSVETIIKKVSSYFNSCTRNFISVRKKRLKTIPFSDKISNDLAERDMKIILDILKKNSLVYKDRLTKYRLGYNLINTILETFPQDVKKHILHEIILSNICNRYDTEVSKHNYRQLVQEYKKNITEINFLCLSLPINSLERKSEIRFSFIESLIKEIATEGTMPERLENYQVENELISSKLIIVARFIKLLTDLFLPNELSSLANLIMIKKYQQNAIKNLFAAKVH